MLVLSIIASVLVIILGGIAASWINGDLRLPRSRHQRCLENIDRLERDVLPWLFEDERRSIDYELGPGVVWKIEDGGKVEWLDDMAQHHVASRAVLNKRLAASALFYSGVEREVRLNNFVQIQTKGYA